MAFLSLARTECRVLSRRISNQMFGFSSAAEKTKENPVAKEGQDDEVVTQTFSGGKGLITLNRPKQLNSLNTNMILKIRKTLNQWKDDKYLIVIKGCGEKAFCAGGDVVTITKNKCSDLGKIFFKEEYKTDFMIASLKVPYVALISGIVMGGGVGVSLFGKYRVATETSLFAMPETQIGFFTDVGVSYLLSRMPQKLGYFLGLTGYRLKGYDLVHAGIATHFCQSQKLPELEKALTDDFSRDIGGCGYEQTLKEFHEEALKSSKDGPPKFTLEPNLKTIETWFSECKLEDVMKKISDDKSKFGSDTLETLKRMSPLSLKVTFRQIQEAADKDINSCFNTDYRLALRMLEFGDFVEGVRALLIDKDKKPKWKHEDISRVADEEVDRFFKALPKLDELRLPESLCEVD